MFVGQDMMYRATKIDRATLTLISNPDLTLFDAWPWEIWVRDYAYLTPTNESANTSIVRQIDVKTSYRQLGIAARISL